MPGFFKESVFLLVKHRVGIPEKNLFAIIKYRIIILERLNFSVRFLAIR